MALIKEDSKRAEGYGYYSSYGADASDVLDYVASDLSDRLRESRSDYGGTEFKVTIIVEQL